MTVHLAAFTNISLDFSLTQAEWGGISPESTPDHSYCFTLKQANRSGRQTQFKSSDKMPVAPHSQQQGPSPLSCMSHVAYKLRGKSDLMVILVNPTEVKFAC